MHLNIYTYEYKYKHMCVCVCVCIQRQIYRTGRNVFQKLNSSPILRYITYPYSLSQNLNSFLQYRFIESNKITMLQS